MKKKLPLFAVLMTFVAWMSFSSCSDDAKVNDTDPQKPTEEVDGGFVYNDERFEIKSTVYTTQEVEGFTSFYFSPTEGIRSVDEMLAADNYVKIAVANPTGKVDLTEEGNQVIYKDVDLNASTLKDFTKAQLSIRLTSHKTMDLSLDVESESGLKLKSEYYGLCSMWPQDDSFDADYICTEVYDSSYLGEVSSGCTNFYIVLTTGPYEVKNEGPNKYVVLKQPGYLLALDLYTKPLENKMVLSTGTYEASEYKNDHSYDAEFSAAVYHDGAGSGRNQKLNGPVTITKEGETYSIQASFIDENGMPMTISFRGELTIVDNSRPSSGGKLPVINHDVEVKGISAKAVYMGNLMQGASGMMTFSIMDEVYADETKAGQGGLAASVVVFGKLFSNPREIEIIPGTYYPARNFSNGSWMPGVEVNAMGFILPMGTYVQKDDGTNMGQFSFGSKGVVEITEVKGGYRIEFDITSEAGYKMKGSYEGPIVVEDQSEPDKTDDGTSTLEEDHDMDLSPISTARLFPRGEVKGATKQYSHYRIDIGARGGWDMDEVLKIGDTFSADLVVEMDDANKIVPGTYKVTEDRYPISMKPGAAIRGHFIKGGEFDGTSWLHYRIGAQDLYLDGHALAYGGEVKIEKARGGENYYTITVDFTCVRKMHVRGTWTGPIINGQTGEPILCSDNVLPEPEEQHMVEMTYVTPEVMRLAAEQLPEVMKLTNLKL